MYANTGQRAIAVVNTNCRTNTTAIGQATSASFHSSSVISASTNENASATLPRSSIDFCDSPSQPVASSRLRNVAATSIAPMYGGNFTPCAVSHALTQEPTHIAARIMAALFVRINAVEPSPTGGET